MGEKDLVALVDIGASNNFVETREAKRSGLKLRGEQGWLKTVNGDAKTIQGVARGVKLRIGDWRGKVNLTVVDMDDYPMVLGMEFLDKAQALVMPYLNSICMIGGDNACTMLVAQEAKRKTRRATGMRIVNKLKEE